MSNISYDPLISKEFYTKLQDDYSRFIYECRTMYCLTGDQTFVDRLGESVIDMEILENLMQTLFQVKDRLVVRGAGNDYWVVKKLFPEFQFALFCDNDPTKIGREIDGKKVVSPDEFYEKYSDYYVLVNSAAANHEIVAELQQHGIPQDKIFNLADSYEAMCDKQYFEKDILPVWENEVFVDGGCYDGRTVRQFINYCDGRYSKIFSFEPDDDNYHRALDSFAKEPVQNLDLINKGLWDCSTTLHFNAGTAQAAKISDEGSSSIETVSIDEVVGDDKVTFIKLDVEGAEYEALQGARKAIERCRPKLAISIYHKDEDIFTLPELIMSMNGDYRFYLRHYQLGKFETILYAIP